MDKLFKSKKLKVAFAAVLTLVVAGMTAAQPWTLVIKEIVGVAVTYIAAQGIADFGKGKAEAENGATK